MKEYTFAFFIYEYYFDLTTLKIVTKCMQYELFSVFECGFTHSGFAICIYHLAFSPISFFILITSLGIFLLHGYKGVKFVCERLTRH